VRSGARRANSVNGRQRNPSTSFIMHVQRDRIANPSSSADQTDLRCVIANDQVPNGYAARCGALEDPHISDPSVGHDCSSYVSGMP
jgi:hypothetical protein